MTTVIKTTHVDAFLAECKMRKNLSDKTIKAYRIDLTQFMQFLGNQECSQKVINEYLDALVQQYQKVKTMKRKIASLKSFFHYIKENGDMEDYSILLRFTMKEPKILPKITV